MKSYSIICIWHFSRRPQIYSLADAECGTSQSVSYLRPWLLLNPKSDTGPLFTMQTDVLLQGLLMSRSREIGCHNISTNLKFDRQLGSAAADVPVIVRTISKILTWSLRFRDFTCSCSKTSVRFVKMRYFFIDVEKWNNLTINPPCLARYCIHIYIFVIIAQFSFHLNKYQWSSIICFGFAVLSKFDIYNYFEYINNKCTGMQSININRISSFGDS